MTNPHESKSIATRHRARSLPAWAGFIIGFLLAAVLASFVAFYVGRFSAYESMYRSMARDEARAVGRVLRTIDFDEKASRIEVEELSDGRVVLVGSLSRTEFDVLSRRLSHEFGAPNAERIAGELVVKD